MVKGRRLNNLAGIALRRFSNYWNPAIWRAIWQQSQRQRWRSLVAEVSFLWLLGLLGGSFALLHISQQSAVPMPGGILQMAHGLRQMLNIPAPAAASQSLGLPLVLAVSIGAGLCWVTGTEKLTYLLATVYQGAPARRPGWAGKLWPWLMTAALLLMVGVVSSLIAPMANPAAPVVSPSPWGGIARLLRSLASLGILILGIGLVHRLSPRQWLPQCPLWPGVGLTVGLGLGVWSVGQGGMRWVQSHNVAYGLFLVFSLSLLVGFLLLWLLPAGAQFNVSSMQHGGGPGPRLWNPRTSPPPPSFESFKINR
jgi:hypothetical protein